MKNESKFWDRLAEGYAKQPIADEDSYQKKLDKTREYFRPGAEVLEIGCGTGSTALLHAPHVKHIRATDLSAKMIEIANRKAREQGVANVTFEQCSIDALAAPDESYDAVLAMSILHLVEDKNAVMAKVHRMLKPGGAFVSSTVCLGDFMGFFKLIAPVGKFFGLIPTVKVFSSDNLLRSFSDAGFDIVHEWRPGKNKAAFVVAKKR
jgi:ubiquinone/menaquinone biosynthesis C-methylase UbiE